MKNPIVALLLAAFLAGGAVGQASFMTLTQNVDNTTVAPGMVTCNTGPTAPQYHVVNSFWRAYDMGVAGVTTPIEVTCIRFGVEFALAGSGGQQPLELRLYIEPSPGTFPAAAPTTPVLTEMFMLPDSSTLATPFWTQGLSAPITVLPTEVLIVELYLPTGVPGMNVFFPGSNQAGETANGFLSSVNCGINVPTPFTSPTLGLANPPHLILDVVYVIPGFSPPPTLAINILGADPMTGLTTFTLTNGDLIPGHEIWNFYSATICTSPGPYLGLCFPNPNDVVMQLQTPLGVEPLHYLATGCSKTMGPFTVPTGISLEVVTVDFNSALGLLNGWSQKATVTF